jgi:2-iminoacetate synthase
MGYAEVLSGYRDVDWGRFFASASRRHVDKVLLGQDLSPDQFASLLSEAAGAQLEEMAERASKETLRNFGRTIQLYTPLYIANYCDNRCLYCGFNSANDIERKRLSPEEVEKEAAHLSSTGIKHILILTGESRDMSPVSYIADCVRALCRYFPSISIEVYPLTEGEYAGLVKEGVDGLTIYQEVYDEDIYKRLHAGGPKSDYAFRLEAPERAARAGMRSVTIGTLFGLDDWRRETFLTGLHAKYLQDKFPNVEIGAAIPRMRPHAGAFKAPFEVTDKNIVQAILALRLFLPRISLSLSTREDARLREALVPLGITRMSAGSITAVGGHTAAVGSGARQFEISDERDVGEVMSMLERKGYQPVLKDWERI